MYSGCENGKNIRKNLMTFRLQSLFKSKCLYCIDDCKSTSDQNYFVPVGFCRNSTRNLFNFFKSSPQCFGAFFKRHVAENLLVNKPKLNHFKFYFVKLRTLTFYGENNLQVTVLNKLKP